MIAHRLVVVITTANGRTYRWGDETDPENIPLSITFSTAIPGGFRDFSCTLMRRHDYAYEDLNALDEVRVVGAGNQTVWEGRVAELPRSHGETMTITCTAVGWQSHLRDDNSFREIYVDRDLNNWLVSPSRRREISTKPATDNRFYDVRAGVVDLVVDATGPAVSVGFADMTPGNYIDGGTGREHRRSAETWYDAKGLSIGEVFWEIVTWDFGDPMTTLTGGNWNDQLILSLTDIHDTANPSTLDNTGRLGTGPARGYWAATDVRKWATLQLVYNGTLTDNHERKVTWRRLAVYGTHGLTKQPLPRIPCTGTISTDGITVVAGVGTKFKTELAPGDMITVNGQSAFVRTITSDTDMVLSSIIAPPPVNATFARNVDDPGGFFIEDIIVDAVTRAAPKIVATTATVLHYDLVVPHALFTEPVTAEDVISQMNRYALRDWFIYEDKVLHWRDPNTYGKVWHVYEGQGASLDEEGLQTEDLYNGVVVAFRDGAGQEYTVGPVGSGSTYESATLQDTDAASPLNTHGYTRKWARVDAGVTYLEGATRIGEIFLAELKQKNVRGQITIRGIIEDDDGIFHPTWKVRAGDRVRVMDAEDKTERRIIETTYSHDELAITMSLDTLPHKLDALLEQLNLALTPYGLG